MNEAQFQSNVSRLSHYESPPTPSSAVLSRMIDTEMNPVLRKLLTLASVIGLAASAYIYRGSFVGLTMDSSRPWIIILSVGVFAVIVPLIAVERASSNDSNDLWRQVFAAPVPQWVTPASYFLVLFAVAHFVLFLVQSHAAGPAIVNGQYVLSSHGRTVKVITDSDYLRLKAAELRLFASGWMLFYFIATVYWFFNRSSHKRRPNKFAMKTGVIEGLRK